MHSNGVCTVICPGSHSKGPPETMFISSNQSRLFHITVILSEYLRTRAIRETCANLALSICATVLFVKIFQLSGIRSKARIVFVSIRHQPAGLKPACIIPGEPNSVRWSPNVGRLPSNERRCHKSACAAALCNANSKVRDSRSTENSPERIGFLAPDSSGALHFSGHRRSRIGGRGEKPRCADSRSLTHTKLQYCMSGHSPCHSLSLSFQLIRRGPAVRARAIASSPVLPFSSLQQTLIMISAHDENRRALPSNLSFMLTLNACTRPM